MNNVTVGLTPDLNILNLKLGIDIFNNADDVILSAYNVPTDTQPERVERTLHAHTDEETGLQHAIMTDENPSKTPFEFFFLPAEKAVMYGLYTNEDSTKMNLYIEGNQAITSGTELYEASTDKAELSDIKTLVPEGHELEGTVFDKEVIEKHGGYYSPSVGDILFVTESQRHLNGPAFSVGGDAVYGKVKYEDIHMVGIVKTLGAFSRADLTVLEKPYVG